MIVFPMMYPEVFERFKVGVWDATWACVLVTEAVVF